MALIIGKSVGPKILESLGLPSDRCRSFELRVAVDEVVTIKAEYYANGDPEAIVETLSGYLVVREEAEAAPLSDQ